MRSLYTEWHPAGRNHECVQILVPVYDARGILHQLCEFWDECSLKTRMFCFIVQKLSSWLIQKHVAPQVELGLFCSCRCHYTA